MASSIETTSTTTTLKNNGNTYVTVDTNDDVTVTNDLAVSGEATATGFTGTLDGVLGGGTPAAATVTSLNMNGAFLQSKAGNTTIYSTNTTGTVTGGIQCLSNQSVRVGSVTNYPTEIVHNNAVKLGTSTTGVTVTGTLTATTGATIFNHLTGAVYVNGGVRAINTTYTNSAAYDKIVYVCCSNTSASALMLNVIDGHTLYGDVDTVANAYYSATLIWPAGKTLKVNMNGNPTLQRWVEFA